MIPSESQNVVCLKEVNKMPDRIQLNRAISKSQEMEKSSK